MSLPVALAALFTARSNVAALPPAWTAATRYTPRLTGSSCPWRGSLESVILSTVEAACLRRGEHPPLRGAEVCERVECRECLHAAMATHYRYHCSMKAHEGRLWHACSSASQREAASRFGERGLLHELARAALRLGVGVRVDVERHGRVRVAEDR